jgi:hypothetical protein
MVVGTGASLSATGSGTIAATSAPANGLTGTALASGVTASSLTSVGTLTGLTVNGTANINVSNNAPTSIGTGTTTHAISIGGGSNTLAINTSNWDVSSAGVASGLTGLTVAGTTNINTSGSGATNIGTGGSAGAVTIGGGSNNVSFGGGSTFKSIAFGSSSASVPSSLAAGATGTATATVTGCDIAGAKHLLATETSYSVTGQTVVVQSVACSGSSSNTAVVTFLNTGTAALSSAPGTLTFKFLLITP